MLERKKVLSLLPGDLFVWRGYAYKADKDVTWDDCHATCIASYQSDSNTWVPLTETRQEKWNPCCEVRTAKLSFLDSNNTPILDFEQ